MPDDPDFPSSEDMLAEARKEMAEPIDEEALLKPVEFDDSMPAATPREESFAFEPLGAVRHDDGTTSASSAVPADVARAIKARLVVGLAVGIVVLIGVIVAALASSGR